MFITSFSLAQTPSRKILFDDDWRFHLGDIESAQSYDFNDNDWRELDLPHDWSIEPLPNQSSDSIVGPFSKKSIGGFDTGQTMGGTGWYRKTFTLTKEEAKKRHVLHFGGAYNQAEVWINGQKVGRNVYGYSAFRFDITPYCKPAGEKNVVAVKVTNEGKNSRWYAGSGLYRHVWLIETAPIHLNEWETAIRSENITETSAEVTVDTKVFNTKNKKGSFTGRLTVLSPKGETVAAASSPVSLPATSSTDVKMKVDIKNPKLWSVESPQLYTAVIALESKGQKVDEIAIPFGLRTLEFSAEKGFLLNGKPTLLQGGCVHHGHGLLGVASYDRAEERKVELMKQNGFNAVRCSHNPFSEAFLDACDRLGMLVIDEAFDQWKGSKRDDDYSNYFEEWHKKDLETLILRDRNHPSIIMWSIGNEIRERIEDSGVVIAEDLKNIILQHDTSRPVTAGVNKIWNEDRTEMLPLDNAFKHLDVDGYNYMWRFYEEEHDKKPEKVMFGSESVAKEAAQNWDKVEKYPYVIGDFVWTAMDYLGEAGLGHSLEVDPEENVPQFMGWPWFNAWCGDLDLCGNKKPQSYYRDVLWRRKAITMAVEIPAPSEKIKKVSFWGWPVEELSWTYPGRENDTLTVNVYSRSPKVRLYLNGDMLGEAPIDEEYRAAFKVPYQKGILRAVNIEDGKEKEEVVLKTTEKPAAVRLQVDRKTIKADGQDLAYVTIELIDKEGNLVYDDNREVEIGFSGSGKVIGSGNASPTDMKSFRSMTPKFFKGRAMVIIKADEKPGTGVIKVESEGLPTASVEITSR